MYVLFRRWTAPKSTHFYVFCLVSFVLYAFKYTGELDAFDQIIYWSNIVATALQPALFLHFAFSFSDTRPDLPSAPPHRPGIAFSTSRPTCVVACRSRPSCAGPPTSSC